MYHRVSGADISFVGLEFLLGIKPVNLPIAIIQQRRSDRVLRVVVGHAANRQDVGSGP